MNEPSPYSPPSAGSDMAPGFARKRKFWKRAIWGSIAMIVVPPLIGLTGTAIGMIGAFGELSQSGTSDPGALAGDISFALLSTLYGLVLSAFGLVFLIVSIIRFRSFPARPESMNP